MEEKYLVQQKEQQEKIVELKSQVEELKVESEQYKLQTDKIRRASVSLMGLPVFHQEERKIQVEKYNEGGKNSLFGIFLS